MFISVVSSFSFVFVFSCVGPHMLCTPMFQAYSLVFSVLRLGPAASGRAGPDEEDDDADDDDDRAAYERAKPPSGVPSSLRVCLAAFGCAEPPSGAQSRLRVCRAPFGCAELPCASLCCISILMSGN